MEMLVMWNCDGIFSWGIRWRGLRRVGDGAKNVARVSGIWGWRWGRIGAYMFWGCGLAGYGWMGTKG